MRWAYSFALMLTVLATHGAEPGPPPREVRVDQYGDPLPEGAVMRLGTARFRHLGATEIVAIDARTFFTVGGGKVRVWESATGKPLSDWPVPGPVNALKRVSPDGRRAAIQTTDALEIWDLPGNRKLNRLPLGNAPSFCAVAFSADGYRVATVDETPRDFKVRVWNLKTGKNEVIGATEKVVNRIEWSPDGRRLYSASFDDECTGWNVAEAKELWRSEAKCRDMRISGDGKRLLLRIADGGDNSIAVIAANNGRLIQRFVDMNFMNLAIAADGNRVAWSTSFHGVSIGECDTGKIVRQEFRVEAQAFHPDGKSLLVATSLGILQAFDIASGKWQYPEPDEFVFNMELNRIFWSADSTHLASQAPTTVWRTDTGRVVGRLKEQIFTRNLAGLSSDGRIAYTYGGGIESGPGLLEHLESWDVVSGKVLRDLKIRARHDPFCMVGEGEGIVVADLSILPNGRTANVQLWKPFDTEQHASRRLDLSTGLLTKFRTFQTPERKYRPLGRVDEREATVFSPDGYFACAGRYLSLRENFDISYSLPFARNEWAVIDLAIIERVTGRMIYALPPGRAGHFAFSPDGRLLAVAALDGLHLWDVPTGKELLFRKAYDRFDWLIPDSFASVLVFSPDGKRLATGHPDSTILIWDVSQPPRPKPASLSKDDLERLWLDLAAPEAAKGMGAVWTLQDHPEQVSALFRERLKPIHEPSIADFKKLLDELDADTYREREEASKRLTNLGDRIRPALWKTANGNLSAEQRKRVEKLLADLEPRNAPRGNDLRTIRCLGVLEHIKTPVLRKLIGEIASGMESARVTREAKACLERLP